MTRFTASTTKSCRTRSRLWSHAFDGDWKAWKRMSPSTRCAGLDTCLRNRSMSFSSRIIVRLTITTCIASCVAYGWLYLKQSSVQKHLHERSLLQQAREISQYLSVNDSGRPELNLPPALSEAYNSPSSTYRYVIRDEVGRIVARSSHHADLLVAKPTAAHEATKKIADD